MTQRRDPFARRRAVSAPDTAPPTAHADPAPFPQSATVLCLGAASSHRRAVARMAAALGTGPTVAIAEEAAQHAEAPATQFVLTAAPDALPLIWAKAQPRHLILPEDNGHWSDMGRRLAAGAGASIATRVVGLTSGRLLCATNLPGQDVEREMAQILLVEPNARGPEPKKTSPDPVVLPEGQASSLTDDLTRGPEIDPDPEALSLTDARFVVAAGAGVKDLKLFAHFARALRATPGASRMLTDAGLMPRDRQVGVSGHSTEAELYVALGISGAVQHLEGMAGCRHVLSVNPDRACAMTARAETAYLGDAESFMRAVLSALESNQ